MIYLVNARQKVKHAIANLVLAVITDQIRPPIKTKKEEKQAILNAYALTINQVPHVFG